MGTRWFARMPKPVEDQPIQVVSGPTYQRNIQHHSHAEKDVREVLDRIVLPALLSNPIEPHKQGAGTPISHGIFSVRVPNSAAAGGKRGGFRLVYHWDRQNKRLTKLSLTIRRDAESVSGKALLKLLAETTTSKNPLKR
jgi:mRNA-degrading endonuclease RelE of RelBE toxin-antitoxin system